MMQGMMTAITHHYYSYPPFLLTDPSIWNTLQRRRPPSDTIQDICDGQAYKAHHDFLKHPSHVSLQLNTDGVAIFRSSKISIWPIWVEINELPKDMRYIHSKLGCNNHCVKLFRFIHITSRDLV